MRKRSIMIMAGAILATIVIAVNWLGYFEQLEVKVSDYFLELKPVSDSICDKLAVVEISDYCVEKYGQWPWPRALQGRLIKAVADRGAKVIGVDVLYLESSPSPEDDIALVDALKGAGNVVLATEITNRRDVGTNAGDFLTPYTVQKPIPAFEAAARSIGLVNVDFVHDNVDGILRKFPLAKELTDGQQLPSMALVLTSLFYDTTPLYLPEGGIRFPRYGYTIPTYGSRFPSVTEDGALPMKASYQRSAYINYDKVIRDGSIPSLFAADLLDTEPPVYSDSLKGRAVLIGVTLSGVDVKLTPAGHLHGVYVQANLVRNLLEQDVLKRISVEGITLILIIVAAIAIFVANFFSVVPAVFLISLLVALYSFASYQMFVHRGTLVDVFPVATLAFAIVLILELVEATVTLKRRMTNLQSLYILGRKFNAVLNLSDLAELVLFTYSDIGNADGAVLMSEVEGGDSLEIEQYGELPDWLLVALGRKKNQRELLETLGVDPKVTPVEDLPGVEYDRFGREEVVFCPLVYHDGATGCICLSGRNLFFSLLDPLEKDYWLALSSIVRNALENARLYKLATIDGLTSLYVRHFFDIAMDREFSRARRYNTPMSLLITDIDKFKNFNDTYGHQMGDRVLRMVASECRSSVRNVDVPCRYGGEEFTFILPDTAQKGALIIAERIRARVEALIIEHHGEIIRITISIGVSSSEISGAKTVKQFIEEADTAMYRAKDTGRNNVCAFDPELDGVDNPDIESVTPDGSVAGESEQKPDEYPEDKSQVVDV